MEGSDGGPDVTGVAAVAAVAAASRPRRLPRPPPLPTPVGIRTSDRTAVRRRHFQRSLPHVGTREMGSAEEVVAGAAGLLNLAWPVGLPGHVWNT